MMTGRRNWAYILYAVLAVHSQDNQIHATKMAEWMLGKAGFR